MPAKYHDYYHALGVSRSATPDEISRAYRALAREFHPDLNKAAGAESRFKEIGEAYEVLKDPEKRSRYDALGANWKDGQEFRPPPDWTRSAGGGGGGGGRRRPDSRNRQGAGGPPDFGAGAGVGMDSAAFSDFFESLFGNVDLGGLHNHAQAHPSGPRPGRDSEAQIVISLADAFHGSTRELSLDDGTSSRTLSVKIPRGITDGSAIRLPGQGAPGSTGGPPGDLLLRVRLAPDPRFRISENAEHDLITTLNLTPSEAALGAKISVQTLAGEVLLTVPPGSQTGQRLRIKGRGLPKKSGDAGDLFADLRVCVPRELSEEEKAAYEQLARVSNFDPRAT